MMPPALAGLRIGCVSYLNSKPLVWALEGDKVTFDVPARLADSFARGELDVALLPVFEILRLGGGSVADNVAIACHGEVLSVLVASRGPFADCDMIYLDPASRSSAALLRVLLAEYYPGGPRLAEAADIPENAARLIIGDPALAFRAKHGSSWQYFDLGSLWEQHTRLPFVFAMWALGEKTGDPGAVAEALRTVKQSGLAARPQIAQGESDPAMAHDYLTNHIRYNVGPEEKKALSLFTALAHKHGLLPALSELDYR